MAEQRLSHSDTARLDAELLLAHVMRCERSHFYTWPEKVPEAPVREAFMSLLARREAGEPVAYLLHRQAFWTLDLEVAPHTLIPRADTELLVELVLTHCFEDARVLDLGTGTGAIALAVASEREDIHVHAVDVIEEAVQLAERNRQHHALSNVRIYRSDWFSAVEGHFDMIVSNPPYIENDDHHLQEGDVRFEPKSALVSGSDGLTDLRIIVSQAPKSLFEGGMLLVEHGWQQAEAVQQLFARAGFENIETVRDYGGRDRVTLGRLPSE